MERFWDKVEKTETCWIWKGAKSRGGYGVFKFNGKCVGTHRVSYILTNGIIPNNLEVCHRCDNPSCVRPDHLFLGTQSENIIDCYRKGRFSHVDKSGPFGERHGSHKLTLAEVVAIRQAKGKATHKELGLRYGVEASTITSILNNKTWKIA